MNNSRKLENICSFITLKKPLTLAIFVKNDSSTQYTKNTKQLIAKFFRKKIYRDHYVAKRKICRVSLCEKCKDYKDYQRPYFKIRIISVCRQH